MSLATHVAEYISSPTQFSSININLYNHSKTFGYPLYMLKDFDTKENDSIGILISDWNAFIGVKNKNIVQAFLYEDDKIIGDTSYFFCSINDTVINNILNIESSNFETYVLQKYLDNTKNINVTKKLEYEIGYKLTTQLNDLVVFKHQENIMNYHADFLLELKNNMNKDIPSIVFEIDEDNHKNYDKENEKYRKQVLQAFGNRIINVAVNRNATQKEIDKIITTAVKQIRDLCNDLIIEYSPEIQDDKFIEIVQEHNIEKSFIKLFFKSNENTDKNTIFKYTHQEVGEFLGFSDTKNYHKFTSETIIKNFTEGKDYIVSKFCFPTDGEAKKRGGHNKKTYLLSRKTFNLICIRSVKPRAKQCAEYFAIVYDIALDYVQKLRAKNIKNEVEIKPKLEAVDKRVEELTTQRLDKYKVVKIEKECNELKEKIRELENIIKENQKIIVEKEEYWKSSIERCELLRKENEKLIEENKKLKESKDTVININVKIDKEVVDKCKEYISKLLITYLKSFCKDIGISGYTSYKKDTKNKLEDLVINTIEKNENIRNKVIDYLKFKQKL
jgi:hypothetical protein